MSGRLPSAIARHRPALGFSGRLGAPQVDLRRPSDPDDLRRPPARSRGSRTPEQRRAAPAVIMGRRRPRPPSGRADRGFSGGRGMGSTLLAWSVLLLGATTDEALAPWGASHHPTDVARRHAQEVTDGRVEYVVVQGGTMDGRNCRSPQGVWQPFEQAWESNRSVRVENAGETDVVNPWLSNGRNDFRSLDRIVAGAVEPGMTDAEKARALWWQEVQLRFHLGGDNKELSDPVKA